MDSIDRLTPCLRPQDRVVMRQRWANLLFLHWEVDPAQLRPHLPPEIELDTFEGRAFIGLVPFTMTGVRPVWAPSVKPLSDFHETNVRTYVHRKGQDPGVWFFSLDAANSIAVMLARTLWRLPYHQADMSMKLDRSATISGSDEGLSVTYSTERLWPAPTPAHCKVNYSVCGAVNPAAAGTLEHFLAERYYLYAYKSAGAGKLYRGQVHHSSYPLQKADVTSLDETMIAAAGVERPLSGPGATPLAHYASEVDVYIYALHRIV